MAKRPKKELIIRGIIRMHPRGFGFLVPDDPSKCSQDVFIPKHLTDNAVDGDQVEISVNLESQSEKGPDGKILSILTRSRTHVAGIIQFIEEAQILAHVPLLGENRPVVIKKGEKNALQVGDRLTLKVLEWGNQKKPTLCEVSHKIGHINDPSCDIDAAIEEYDLQGTFPKNVITEAKAFGKQVSKQEQKERFDLSKIPCITIDPETAKDFDDALTISQDKQGHFFLGVHIADVAHYVQAGSALDKEALRRCNSTYFPGKCVPMLPEELSNNLCSLRQDAIRLTVSVLMEFDAQGTLVDSQVKRTCIKSQKRFTYEEAKQVLEGKKKSPHAKALKQMEELCQLLKKKRSERGSIDFALPELIIIVDKDGKPTGVKIEQYHITHQLVEEFMLKANETVAKHLSDRGKSQLFRIHEEPSEENLQDFFATARSLGFQIPPKPTNKDLQALFKQAQDTPFSNQLAIGFIRTLKLAFYSPRNVGHYGLSLEHYCHFTSPIRRYSDLVTQRLLFDQEEEGLELEKIGQKCSDKERVSFRAEMSVKLLKKHRLLKSWHKEDPRRNYAANITKIKPFGLYFDVKELFLEGFLHISELESDYFIYEPTAPLLRGEKTGKRYVIGEEITVRPLQIDLIHMEAGWELVTEKKRKKRKPRK